MSIRNRKSLAGLVALSAALAMPLAFAQEAQEVQEHTTEDATGAAVQQQAQSAAAAGNQSWAELDVDGDGNISLQEAQAHAGLAQIFEHADANADGQLSQDEYQSYVERSQSPTPETEPGN